MNDPIAAYIPRIMLVKTVYFCKLTTKLTTTALVDLWDVAGSSPKCLESQHYSNTIRKRSDQALTQQLHDTLLHLSLTLSLWNKDGALI